MLLIDIKIQCNIFSKGLNRINTALYAKFRGIHVLNLNNYCTLDCFGGVSFVNCPLKPWPLFAYTLYSTRRALKESAKKASIMRISAVNEDTSFIEKRGNWAGKFCRLFTATMLISNHSSDTKTLIKDYMLLDQANIWLLPLTESSYVFLERSRPLLHAIVLHYV